MSVVPVALPVERDQVDDQDGEADHHQLERAEEEIHSLGEQQADEDQERRDEEGDLGAGADRDPE